MDEQRRQLIETAKQIRDWQKTHVDKDGRDYTTASFLRAYPALGTDRVYSRILAGDVAELDVNRWLAEYAAVAELLQMEDARSREDDPVYDDLTGVLDLRKAVSRVMREKGINRLVVMQMPQGCGKTTSARIVAGKFGARAVYCEATEIWRENINAMLGGLLLALGVQPGSVPVSQAARWMKVCEILTERRRCLLIDEAHHLGLRTLNLIKSLINQTPGEVVLLAMDTLWRRLEMAACEEARQLTQNRLMERIRAEGANESDVKVMLERRLGMKGKDAGQAAKEVVRVGKLQGNLTFANLVCREAKGLAEGGEVTLETIAKAIAGVAGTR